MTLLASLRMALRALVRNKLRSFLAILGIIIAVAAVVATVSIGQGAQAKVARQMASLGSNLLIVLPGSMMMHGAATGTGAAQTLSIDDARAIGRELGASVAAVAPVNRTTAQVVYGDRNWFTQVQGTTPAYFAIRDWTAAAGAVFGAEDDGAAAKVCLLGKTVADRLFTPGAPIVGEQIRVMQLPCRVIGVLAPKGQGSAGQDQDDLIVMPWSTLVRRIIGSQANAVGQLMVSARSAEAIPRAEREVAALLRQRHHRPEAAPQDFQIRNLAEMQDAARESAHTIAVLLGSVALISLLVGAIGIANVMLVSVTERTREIGIRLSVGARARDVLFQFLTESVVLATAGGLLGLALGVGVSRYMALRSAWPTVLSVQAMAAALGLAALAGILAGFYPALRASRLNPIDAIRFE